MSVRALLVVISLVGGGLAGCGDSGDESSAPIEAREPASTSTSTDVTADGPRPPAPEVVPEVECPPGLADCVTAGGEIVTLESKDPDGDGDAHFVLVSREGITAPGISVIDVRADLRPDPLPGVGELMSAAGPVFEGSFGQRQIQAEAVAFEGR